MKKNSLLFMLFLLTFTMFTPLNVKADDEDCWHYQTYGKHDFKYNKTITWATPVNKGIDQYKCTWCKRTCQKTIIWSYKKSLASDNGCACYDIDSHSALYKNSKYITVKCCSWGKKYTLKVKIGKKTYTRKMTKQKIKIKIKSPSNGSKITIKVYYKNKCIGKHKCAYDKVLYAKNIRIGLTKSQLKRTYRFIHDWGSPSQTATSSGGWSYWYYSDGSEITFKNGKVYSWYDVG